MPADTNLNVLSKDLHHAVCKEIRERAHEIAGGSPPRANVGSLDVPPDVLLGIVLEKLLVDS